MSKSMVQHPARTPAPAAVRPGPATPRADQTGQDILRLQREAGNSAVAQLIASTTAPLPAVQRGGAGSKAKAKAPPKVNHASGADVDKFLLAESTLTPFVESRMKSTGWKGETSIKIQNAADFKKDWVTYAMGRTNSATGNNYTKEEAEKEEPDINAFTDEPTIHVHENRGERGTTIHETLHLLQDNTFYAATGFNVSEGITEKFTRLVAMDQKITRGEFYSDQRDSIGMLILASSKEKVADAYFNNKPEELKKDIEAKKAGNWDKWVTAMKAGKYEDADKLTR
jgi:hypothetical protein